MPGHWSPIEAFWTALACAGLLMNTAKLWLVGGDLLAVYALGINGRRRLAAWWVVVNALKDQIVFAGFALIGWVAGQLPPRSVPLGAEEVAASDLTGAVLIACEAAMVASVGWTLWARWRIGVTAIRRRRALDRTREGG